MGRTSELEALLPQHNVTLNTERLHLRPVKATDLHALHKIRRNPRVMQYMSTGVETEEDPLKCHSFERIKIMTTPGRFTFTVQLKAPAGGDQDAEPIIGFLGLMRPPATSYLFDEPYWGKGYATEGYRAFLDSYWETFPTGLPDMAPEDRNTLYAHVDEGNRGSERVLEKTGFKLLRRELSKPDECDNLWESIFQIHRPTSAANVVGKDNT